MILKKFILIKRYTVYFILFLTFFISLVVDIEAIGYTQTDQKPIQIESENYSVMCGVQSIITADGEEIVSWINKGDWMDYEVGVNKSGFYQVEYRVFPLSNSINFELRDRNSVLDNQNVQSSGEKNWEIISGIVRLPTGSNILTILATGGRWNIDWFRIKECNFPVILNSYDLLPSKNQILVEINNLKDRFVDGSIIVRVLDEQKISKIIIVKQVTLGPGTSCIIIKNIAFENMKKIKIFLWDSIDSMVPLSLPLEVESL